MTGKLWNANHGKANVEKACRKTLRDLRLKQLDLYLIHWPVAGANRGAAVTPPLRETWQAMEALVDAGLVKAIGLSNFSVKKAQAVLEYARVRPSVIQVRASDACWSWGRSCKRRQCPMCAEWTLLPSFWNTCAGGGSPVLPQRRTGGVVCIGGHSLHRVRSTGLTRQRQHAEPPQRWAGADDAPHGGGGGATHGARRGAGAAAMGAAAAAGLQRAAQERHPLAHHLQPHRRACLRLPITSPHSLRMAQYLTSCVCTAAPSREHRAVWSCLGAELPRAVSKSIQLFETSPSSIADDIG